jgi:transcription initiation factor IIF auxiliary subunit
MKKQSVFLSHLLLAIVWIFLINTTSSASAQEISASNISRYVGNGRWDWTIFIVAPHNVINEIECVEYTLHPSFPNPLRRICTIGDPRYPFSHTTNGWGVFEISIKVIFKNSRILQLRHMLTLKAAPVEYPLPITANNVATRTGEEWWNWTIFIEGPEEALNQIQCVEYTLHPTFSNPVQEVCSRGIGPHAFAFSARGWGTFAIQIRVFLKNGQVQRLVHNLRF